jgi:deoxyadenosine/deoxycytidine kinase
VSSEPAHRFIVVEGPIGVGKTTLARRLGVALGAELVLEDADANPFLERFYRDPAGAALPAQLHFLFQRAQQLGGLRQQDLFASARVADYLFDKDRLFARLTLDEAEFALYEQVAARMAVDPPRPDLVLYLQAPVDVLLGRIARRGLPAERQIERGYLERLNQAYARFFHDYDAAPLLIINAETIDPVGRAADFEELLAAVRRMRRGRLYYNTLRSPTI